jgi:hypothetical protein
MELKTYRHLRGVTEPNEIFFPRTKQEGHAGVEGKLPEGGAEETSLRELLEEHGLEYIAKISTTGDKVADHISSFKAQLSRALKMKPVLINCHGGRDSWSFWEAVEFYRAVMDVETEHGVHIAHETHRGRVFYNPWITRDLLHEIPGIGLCCDFSHWVCVTERLLEDCEALIQIAARHCVHIHARVGYEEGPQVPDPRAPEYSAHVQAHEAWWDIVWKAQEEKGLPYTTLTPDFAPPPYLQTEPFSERPIANLDDICRWQADRQRRRFAART